MTNSTLNRIAKLEQTFDSMERAVLISQAIEIIQGEKLGIIDREEYTRQKSNLIRDCRACGYIFENVWLQAEKTAYIH